jgi:general secretion pathway protein J
MRQPASPISGKPRSTGSGFTLIELLVAMAVLAALAAVSFRGLGSILEAEARVRSETRRWNDIAVVMAHMGHDLSMAAARTSRNGAGIRVPALSLDGPQRGAPAELMFTRLGEGEGGSAQADLRRIGFRLNAETLHYLAWPTVDSSPDVAPSVHAILENVVQLNLRALDADGTWVATWPGKRAPDALPRAIEAQFELAGGERITRLFLLK